MEWVREEGKKTVAIWLYAIAFLIFAMVVLGGLTRLTGSGLSMVEWKVIMGVLPPANEAQWQEKFERYKQFPEYRHHNSDMTLTEFRFIYRMEYAHRLLGRFIGLAFFFPCLFFLLKKWLYAPMIRRAILLFALGGLQGVVGWLMVKSGLVDEPRVSQYRLTLHLALATLVLSLSLWYAFNLWFPRLPKDGPGLARLSRRTGGLLFLIGLQIASGGFVAGLKAGHAFNTFPTMNGRWIPGSLFSMKPWISNFFENQVTVQFVHRWLAMIVAAAILWFLFGTWRRFESGRIRKTYFLLAALLLTQVGLGIATLLLAVPVALGSVHQAIALLLWSAAVFLHHQCASDADLETA